MPGRSQMSQLIQFFEFTANWRSEEWEMNDENEVCLRYCSLDVEWKKKKKPSLVTEQAAIYFHICRKQIVQNVVYVTIHRSFILNGIQKTKDRKMSSSEKRKSSLNLFHYMYYVPSGIQFGFLMNYVRHLCFRGEWPLGIYSHPTCCLHIGPK